jgi:HJR/Mrr/RecB family endonuclease
MEMALEDFLRLGEVIEYRGSGPVEHQGEKYDFYLTNARLLWHRHAFLKRDALVAEDKQQVRAISYSEVKGPAFIRGVLTIETPDKKLEFVGPSHVMQGIYARISSDEEITRVLEEERRRKEEEERKKLERRRKMTEARAKAKREREALQKAFQEKQQTLEAKVNRDPTNPLAHFELAQFFFEEKRSWEEARDSFQKALALGLSDPRKRAVAHHCLGCRCYDIDDACLSPAEKKESYKFIWDPYPESYAKYPWRFAILHAQIQARTASPLWAYLKEAVKDLRLALKSNPDDIESAKRLAHVYLVLDKKREYDRAVALIEEIETRLALRAAPRSAAKGAAIDRSGISFEEKCMKLLEKLGFVCRRTAITGDGGIDIIAVSNQTLFKGTYIVQCKNWQNPVGEPVVRDLYGVVAAEHANKGILITTSTFTQAAESFAQGKNIELIDGEQLEQLVGEHGL